MSYEGITPEREFAYLLNAADVIEETAAAYEAQESPEDEIEALGFSQKALDIVMDQLVKDAEFWANASDSADGLGDEVEAALPDLPAATTVGEDYMNLLEQRRAAECNAQIDAENEAALEEDEKLSPLGKAFADDVITLVNQSKEEAVEPDDQTDQDDQPSS